MRILSSFLMLIGALAVLSLSVVGASASPEAGTTAPCHETSHQADRPMPGKSSDHAPKALKAMACCVACVAPPMLAPADLPDPVLPPARVVSAPVNLPSGRRPSPEPGPPRLPIV